jgi:hypothetical protein
MNPGQEIPIKNLVNSLLDLVKGRPLHTGMNELGEPQ